MALPRFVSLKSYNGKYLQFVKEDGNLHGYLQASGDEVVSPYTKFEIQPSLEGGGDKAGLVSIRSCYNNKYWTRLSESDHWIVARSDEPEESDHGWKSTLFEPTIVNGEVRFRHVRKDYYLTITTSFPSYEFCLNAYSTSTAEGDVFTIIDWDSCVGVLPRHIAFKIYNGNSYIHPGLPDSSMITVDYRNRKCHSIENPDVLHEVFTMNDGSVRIRNVSHGLFYKRTGENDNHIKLNTEGDDDFNLNSLFSASNDSTIRGCFTLRNLGNKGILSENFYCIWAMGTSNLSISDAQFYGKEPVLLRNIYDVNFHEMDRRIYNQIAGVAVDSKHVINDNPDSKNIGMTIMYRDTRSSTWNGNASCKYLDVQTYIEATIPSITDKNLINFGPGFSRSSSLIRWGQTETVKPMAESHNMVLLPPKTLLRVTLVADMVSFDIPFSYTQCDTLTSGEKVIYEMEDGMYTVTQYYKFRWEVTEEKL